MPCAGRANACRWRFWSWESVQCPTIWDASVGRPVHGPAKGSSSRVDKVDHLGKRHNNKHSHWPYREQATQVAHSVDGHTSRENHEGVFSRQALPIVWDFSEGNPFSESTGNYGGAVDWVADVVDSWPGSNSGQVQQSTAVDHPLPSHSVDTWFTDPPYYDAIPYADLSDFFLVWLRRTLLNHPLLRNAFEPGNELSPKTPRSRSGTKPRSPMASQRIGSGLNRQWPKPSLKVGEC